MTKITFSNLANVYFIKILNNMKLSLKKLLRIFLSTKLMINVGKFYSNIKSFYTYFSAFYI